MAVSVEVLYHTCLAAMNLCITVISTTTTGQASRESSIPGQLWKVCTPKSPVGTHSLALKLGNAAPRQLGGP